MVENNGDEVTPIERVARLQDVIEIWKKSVEVQQHFNDIAMKIRNLYITILAVIAAAYGVLLKEEILFFEVANAQFNYVLVMILVGAGAASLFYFMDRHWYHRLLLGAVKHAGEIEAKYKEELPELALGKSIAEKSPVRIGNRLVRLIARAVVSDDRYKSTGKLHSDAKIELFYKPVIYLLFAAFLLFGVFGGIKVGEDESLARWLISILRGASS